MNSSAQCVTRSLLFARLAAGPKGAPPAVPPIVINPVIDPSVKQAPKPSIDPRVTPAGPPVMPPPQPSISLQSTIRVQMPSGAMSLLTGAAAVPG